MNIWHIAAASVLIGAGAFTATEVLRPREGAAIPDRCAEISAAATRAFEASPMARSGLRITELANIRRAEPPEGALPPEAVLCLADATLGWGTRDTLWFSLVPKPQAGQNQFMVNAALGDVGRRNILSLR
jgi:hypothetical protein